RGIKRACEKSPSSRTEAGAAAWGRLNGVTVRLNLNGQPTSPFRVRGLPVEEVFAHYDNPGGIDDLDRAIDTNMRRRRLGDILKGLENLNDAVLAHHIRRGPGPASASGPTSVVD
ncbi:hypothetical protein AB0C13_38640, partial [Streptomyces sp. NPDC049099]